MPPATMTTTVPAVTAPMSATVAIVMATVIPVPAVVAVVPVAAVVRMVREAAAGAGEGEQCEQDECQNSCAALHGENLRETATIRRGWVRG